MTTTLSVLISIFAVIGLFTVLGLIILLAWVGLQLTTDDKLEPRKPWWWRV